MIIRISIKYSVLNAERVRAILTVSIPAREGCLHPRFLAEDEFVCGQKLISGWGAHHGDYRSATRWLKDTSWENLNQVVESEIRKTKETLKRVAAAYDRLMAAKPNDWAIEIEI